MEKYSNLIIRSDDPRYGKLGHIWKKYNWNNIVINTNPFIYRIPSELVLHDYFSGTNWVTPKIPEDVIDPYWIENANIISSKGLCYCLSHGCELTVQEFFDLVILHINDTSNRPRCALEGCSSPVKWGGRMSFGYNVSRWWCDVKATYCCDSHAKLFQAYHPELYPDQSIQIKRFLEGGYQYEVKVYSEMMRYINMGNPYDIIIIYYAITCDGDFKFGLTYDLQMRKRHERINGGDYKSIHAVLYTNRLEASYIEAKLKLKFKAEYLEFNMIHSVSSEIKTIISNRPIANPFE